MTPEQEERIKYEALLGNSFKDVDSFGMYDPKRKRVMTSEELLNQLQMAAWVGWLAAKQDSEQQRKELQERINHDPQY